MLKAIAFGPGLPIRTVWPSPLLRATSDVPMVPPAPDRFSTIADWPQFVCKCAASNRPITSVLPPGAAGTIRRTVSDGRQSARLVRGRMVAAERAAAPHSTRRRERTRWVTLQLPALFCRKRRERRPLRQADDLAQAGRLSGAVTFS